jgi:hypothetical protein
VFDQCDKAVVLGTAGATHCEMHSDAGESGAGGASADLGLDVLLEHPAGGSAAGIAVIDLEDHFEHAAVAR